jgi:hypothetical protein
MIPMLSSQYDVPQFIVVNVSFNYKIIYVRNTRTEESSSVFVLNVNVAGVYLLVIDLRVGVSDTKIVLVDVLVGHLWK